MYIHFTGFEPKYLYSKKTIFFKRVPVGLSMVFLSNPAVGDLWHQAL
jgi:hypothetical protein